MMRQELKYIMIEYISNRPTQATTTVRESELTKLVGEVSDISIDGTKLEELSMVQPG